MKFLIVIAVVLLVSAVRGFRNRQIIVRNPVVKTRLGAIQGTVMRSRENRIIQAFRGIRYAEPPIGSNRFKPPVPVKSWPGVYDATDDGPICPQPNKKGYVQMSEDCLILNVYTTDLNGNKPVLVYIHGGAFAVGSSHSREKSGPQYLLDKDVVLVTINYRLGPLGFMSTDNQFAPGNYGLKDQNMALKWIRDNIRSFGGNPESVTISGQSAGSMSITLHIVSPISRGLFHRAIAASGSSASHIEFDHVRSAKFLADNVGCQWVPDSQITVDCLRNKTHEEIIAASDKLNKIDPVSKLQWYYRIEENRGEGEFLTENPTNLLARGNFARVPILTGITKDEFAVLAHIVFGNPTLAESINTNFEGVAPLYFQYDANSKNAQNISRTLRKFYLNDEKLSAKNIQGFEDLFSDAMISHGEHQFVTLARRYTNVFYYRLDFIGRYSKFYDPDAKPHGVAHADELQYLFVADDGSPMFTDLDPENLMVERLTSWWTTFAKTGQPNNPSNKWISSVVWLPSNKTNLISLNINKELKLTPEPFQDRFKLWDRLFPYPHSN